MITIQNSKKKNIATHFEYIPNNNPINLLFFLNIP